MFLRYLKTFFSIVTIYFFMCIFVNIIVDPYNELGRNKIGLYYSTERQAKKEILKYEHDAILIGSSRTRTTPPEKLLGYKFYNASFPLIVPEEIYYFLKKYVWKEKLVVIGLDFEMFNETVLPFREMDQWNDRQFGLMEYVMGFNVFHDSIGSLYKKYVLKEGPLIAQDGHYVKQDIVNAEVAGIRNMFSTAKVIDPQKGMINPKELQEIQEILGGVVSPGYRGSMAFLASHHFRRFVFSKKRMDYLMRIKKSLDERGIKCIVFVGPYNEDVLAMMQRKGYMEMFEEWKKELRSIFVNFYDESCCQYSGRSNFGATDPQHYRPEVGVEFLNKILNDHEK